VAVKQKVEVVMENIDHKKGSVKFTTSRSGVSPNNIYMKNEVWESLGRPEKVKVTVQSA
jgi:hypothetical protein